MCSTAWLGANSVWHGVTIACAYGWRQESGRFPSLLDWPILAAKLTGVVRGNRVRCAYKENGGRTHVVTALAIKGSNHRGLDDTGGTRQRHSCPSSTERQFSWQALARYCSAVGFCHSALVAKRQYPRCRRIWTLIDSEVAIDCWDNRTNHVSILFYFNLLRVT